VTIQRTRTATHQCRSWQKNVWIGALAVSPVVAGEMQQTTVYHYPPPEIVRAPDSNRRDEINQLKIQKQNFDAANTARKKLIDAESAELLKLATEIEAELDQSNSDTLSFETIRKAEEVERLAHDIKQRMKLTVGAS
jgi:hypothetical protein